MVSVEQVKSCLSKVVDPNTGKDFVSSKSLRDVRVADGVVTLAVELSYPALSQQTELTDLLANAVSTLAGVTRVQVGLSTRIATHAVQRGLKPLQSVKNIIAVASGKGGVGKSTTAVNLALALSSEGARVGVLDADIYGPSLPMMLGIDVAKSGKPQSADGKTIEPMHAHGLQASSIGFMIDQDQPMVWRGPMATQALQQLLEQTNWSELDYLIIDLPPGTGDIQLSLSQKVPLTGAVIVTTPQDIALLDARKGLRMFEKVGVPILGIVENMAVHICTNCGHAEHIFGADGGKRMAQQYNVDYLGALPLDINIREQTDAGNPTVVAAPDSAIAQTYRAIARKVAVRVGETAKDMSLKFPTIVVQNT
jgi:ATP-binding protein involved in chromosome partitioning